ncbi:unnamed protein product [Protopolystoma xenopodis]|uniref:RMI1 N-terminal domain-containing protein n=1 Tax=Protopolystoma xenopodis TaxID=117903 RepID=A0A448WSZ2_9PLAT|nr:unnamed protein product [Protopolystoma xenopodis]
MSLSTSSIEAATLQSITTCLHSLGVHPNPEWLTACLVWLRQEHGSGPDWPQALDPEALSCLVLQQWLHADLHEIGWPLLPTEGGDDSTASGPRQPGPQTPPRSFLLEDDLCLQVSQ